MVDPFIEEPLTDEGEKRGDFDPETIQTMTMMDDFRCSAQLGFGNFKTLRRQNKEPEFACLNWTRDISSFSTSLSQVILYNNESDLGIRIDM